MKKLTVLFIGLLWGYVFAQECQLSGVVKDAGSGETIPFAVLKFGSSQGASADINGKYSINLAYGTYTVQVSSLGYITKTAELTANSPQQIKNFSLGITQLAVADVVVDIAKERETPVAFTNVLPAQIKEELGSQQVPMILNSTPGVYATPAGGGGDARVSIRGFKQRNVAVLFDGIPVNDMETGDVYWSNWFGADLIMRTTQVQRGLGASKLTVPAIGGTINIVTKSIDSKKSFSIKQEVGSFNQIRSSLGYNSGRLENGWGVTFAASYMNQGGYFDKTYNTSFFYFLKLEKQFKNHLLSFTAFGAPTQTGNTGNRNPIATYSKDYARSLFKGDDDLYARLAAFNQARLANDNFGISDAEFEQVAQETGFVDGNGEINYSGFEELQASNDFIDTTLVVEGGLNYNNHWGFLQDTSNADSAYRVVNERERQYHKPLVSLKHTWTANDRLTFSNIAYFSQGIGGGTSRAPNLGAGDYTLGGPGSISPPLQVNFQRDFLANTEGGLFGPPIDQVYSDTELKSGVILQKSFNNHYWVGLLSSADYQINEFWRMNLGVDLRTYEGNSFREVYDLLGGDYYIGPADEFNINETTSQDRIKREGDVISFNSESLVRWAGVYSLLEYKKEPWSAFLNVTGVQNWYKRRDFFLQREETDEINTTDWKVVPGFTAKAGANYNLTEQSSVFMNIGYLSRTPQFRNVIDFTNQFIQDLENENIQALELGYSYGKKNWALSANAYYTIWQNRPLQGGVFVLIDDRPARANLNAMNARHMGIELGGTVKVAEPFDLDFAMSFGDWRWTSKDSVNFFDESRQLLVDEAGDVFFKSFDADGVLVGDAPQAQISVGARYAAFKNFYIKPRYTYFDKYYSDFDPLGLEGDKAGKQSWKIPAYGLLDVHTGYQLQREKFTINFRASVFNALNTIFISDAQNNAGTSILTLENGWNPRNTVLFDANSAGVTMGFGRRYNLSVELSF